MTDEQKTEQDSAPNDKGKSFISDEEKKRFEEHYYKYKGYRRGPLLGLLLALIVVVFVFIGVAAASMVGHRGNNKIGREVNVNRNFNGMGMGMMGGKGRFGHMNGQVSGKVTAVNGKTFTLDIGSNTTKTVQISDTTRFPISSDTNIAVGSSVTVWGGQDSSGVIQATTIVIN